MESIIEPTKLKARTTYNAAADYFDDGPLAFWDRYGQRTIERLRLRPGSVILDVGCGSGASAIPAAKVVGPHGRVIGVDLADRLLAIARAKATAQKLQNIEFREGDMEALGYPDASFDAVVCVFAIFFVPDMVKQIKVPIQAHYGTADAFTPVEDVRKFEQALRVQGTPIKTFFYEGAKHAFCNYERPNYDAPACTLALRRTLEFLKAQFRPSPRV